MTDLGIDIALQTRFGISKEVSDAMVAEILLNTTEEAPSHRPMRIAKAIRHGIADAHLENERNSA